MITGILGAFFIVPAPGIRYDGSGMNLPRKEHVIERRGRRSARIHRISLLFPLIKAKMVPSHSVLLAFLQLSKTESETFCSWES